MSDVISCVYLFKAGTGLKVVLDVQPQEYLESHDSEDLGIKFQAHHWIEPAVLKDKGLGFAPGYHYQIALQQKEVITSQYVKYVKFLPPIARVDL